MKTQSLPQRLCILRASRELREQLHFDGAQKRLRRPETKTDLHDVVRCGLFVHPPPLLGCRRLRPQSLASGIISGKCLPAGIELAHARRAPLFLSVGSATWSAVPAGARTMPTHGSATRA